MYVVTMGVGEIESVASSIMLSAQHLVDRWFRDTYRGPFRRTLDQAMERQWPGADESDPRRQAFVRVANAIRLGRGHAYADPEPLSRIIEEYFPSARPAW